MQYEPSRDAFKYALNPTELKDDWNKIESYVYVISKKLFLDERRGEDDAQEMFKIGISTVRGKSQRLMDARTYLIQFFVHRIYLFERFQLPGEKKSIDSATYAFKAERHLHKAVEQKYKPRKVRVNFPGSTPGFESNSEWFIIPPDKRADFLRFLDQTVYKDVGVPPMYGSKFTASERCGINLSARL